MQKHIDTLEKIVNCFQGIIRPNINHTVPVPTIIFSHDTAALETYVYQLGNDTCPGSITHLTEELLSCLDRLPTLAFDIRLASLGLHLMILVLKCTHQAPCHSRGPLILARYLALCKDKIGDYDTCITPDSAQLLLRLSVTGILPNTLNWKCLRLLNKLLSVCPYLKPSLVSFIMTNELARLAIGNILYSCNDYTCQAQTLELIGRCILSSHEFRPKSLWQNSQPEFLWALFPNNVKAGDESCNNYITVITNYRKAQSLPICTPFEFHHIELSQPTSDGCQDAPRGTQYGPLKGALLTGHIIDERMILWIPKNPHSKFHTSTGRPALVPIEIDLSTTKSVANEETSVILYLEATNCSTSKYSLCTTSKSWARATITFFFSEQASATHLSKNLSSRVKIPRRVSAPIRTLSLSSRTPSSRRAETITSASSGSLRPVKITAESTFKNEQISAKPTFRFRVSAPVNDINISAKSDLWDYINIPPIMNSPKRPQEKFKPPPSPSLSALSSLDTPDRTPEPVAKEDAVINKNTTDGEQIDSSQLRHVSIDLDHIEELASINQQDKPVDSNFKKRFDANWDQLDQSQTQSKKDETTSATAAKKNLNKGTKLQGRQKQCKLTLVNISTNPNTESGTQMANKSDVSFNEKEFIQTSTTQRRKSKRNLQQQDSLGSPEPKRNYSKKPPAKLEVLQTERVPNPRKVVRKRYGKRTKKGKVQGDKNQVIEKKSEEVRVQPESIQPSISPKERKDHDENGSRPDQSEDTVEPGNWDDNDRTKITKRPTRPAASNNVVAGHNLRHKPKKRKVSLEPAGEIDGGDRQISEANEAAERSEADRPSEPIEDDLTRKKSSMETGNNASTNIATEGHYHDQCVQADGLKLGKQMINPDNDKECTPVQTNMHKESTDAACQCNLANNDGTRSSIEYPPQWDPHQGSNVSFDIIRDVVLGARLTKGFPALFWTAGILVSEKLDCYQKRLVDIQKNLEKEMVKIITQAHYRRMDELKSEIDKSKSNTRHACSSAIELLYKKKWQSHY